MKVLSVVLRSVFYGVVFWLLISVIFIFCLAALSMFGFSTKFDWFLKTGEFAPTQQTIDHYNQNHPPKE